MALGSMTTAQMITRFRMWMSDRADYSTDAAAGYWPDSTIVNYLNQAQADVATLLADVAPARLMKATAAITLTEGIEVDLTNYLIPLNASYSSSTTYSDYGRVVKVVRADVTPVTQVRYAPFTAGEPGEVSLYGDDFFYTIAGNKMIFYNVPTGATAKIYYLALPPDMVAAVVDPPVTAVNCALPARTHDVVVLTAIVDAAISEASPDAERFASRLQQKKQQIIDFYMNEDMSTATYVDGGRW